MRRSARALLLVALAGLGVSPRAAYPAATAAFRNTTGISVPAAGAAAPYPSSITVSGLTGQLVKVTVTLIDLSHGHAPDLDILLVGPGGQTVLLLSDCCNRAPVIRARPTFDDFGRRLTVESSVPSSAVKPVNFDVHTDAFPAPAPAGPYGTRLSAFNGTDPNGTWRLFVHDDQPRHEGTIAGGWSLTLHTEAIANTPPAARLASTDVPAVLARKGRRHIPGPASRATHGLLFGDGIADLSLSPRFASWPGLTPSTRHTVGRTQGAVPVTLKEVFGGQSIVLESAPLKRGAR